MTTNLITNHRFYRKNSPHDVLKFEFHGPNGILFRWGLFGKDSQNTLVIDFPFMIYSLDEFFKSEDATDYAKEFILLNLSIFIEALKNDADCGGFRFNSVSCLEDIGFISP